MRMTENTEEENILKSSRFLKLFDLSTLSLVDLHFQKSADLPKRECSNQLVDENKPPPKIPRFAVIFIISHS